MNKKDYELLADINREAFESGLFGRKRFGQFCALAADRLQEANPGFNRIRFLRACGLFQ